MQKNSLQQITPQDVTHNNDGHPFFITMDIAKEGTEVWDLTPWFKGRQGDSRITLEAVLYQQGKRMKFNDDDFPYIHGNVGNYFVDKENHIQMDPDAAVVTANGTPEDLGEGGRVTYRFPPEMFPKSGIFKGFIGIKNSLGQVSGVTVWFKVLPGLARMGHAKEVYVDEIEQMKLEFAAKQRAKIADFTDAVENIKQQMDAAYKDALDKHNQNFDEEMAEIKAKLDEANQLAQGILDSDHLLSQALDANTEAIKNHMAPMLNQSNVFKTTNTFEQGAVMQNGLTVNGPLLVNGVDLSVLADKVDTLQVDVNHLKGGN